MQGKATATIHVLVDAALVNGGKLAILASYNIGTVSAIVAVNSHVTRESVVISSIQKESTEQHVAFVPLAHGSP